MHLLEISQWLHGKQELQFYVECSWMFLRISQDFWDFEGSDDIMQETVLEFSIQCT